MSFPQLASRAYAALAFILVAGAGEIPVPISVRFAPNSASPSPLESATVTLCALDFAAYSADPSAYPMFRDLLARSGCVEGGSGAQSVVSFLQLEREQTARGCGADALISSLSPRGCVPTGLVLHESRCGSTLVANMLATLPHSLTYSESAPLFEILTAPGLDDESRARALRVVVSAMGKPLERVEGGSLFLKLQSQLTLHLETLRRAFPSVPWAFVHRDGVEVLASLFRGARSQPLPNALPTQGVNADELAVRRAPCMRGRDHGASAGILAIAGTNSSAEVFALPAEEYCAASVALLCASALHHATAARSEGLRALKILPPPAGHAILSDYIAEDLSDGRVVAALSSESGGAFLVAGGIVLGADGRGVLGGIGQGFFIDYKQLPEAAIALALSHFGVGVASNDSIAALLSVGAKYSKARASSSGARGSDVGASLRGSTGKITLHRPDLPSMDSSGNFVPDGDEKQSRAWPALRTAAAKFLEPLRAAMLRFNPPAETFIEGKAPAAVYSALGESNPLGSIAAPQFASLEDELTAIDAAVERYQGPDKTGVIPGQLAALLRGLIGKPSLTAAVAPEIASISSLPPLEVGYDAARHQLPLGAGYPMLFPLAAILGEWSSDIVSVPPTYGRFSSLRVFNWSRCEVERAEMLAYRRAEVPFVVRGVPSLDRAAQLWADDSYFVQRMAGFSPPFADSGSNKPNHRPSPQEKPYPAEVNANSNHFMYWNKGKARQEKKRGWVPPTTEGEILPSEWLSSAREVEREVEAEERAQLPDWWFAAPNSSASSSRNGISTPVAPPLTRKKRTLHYMRASTDQRNPGVNAWIREDLPLFDASPSAPNSARDEASFFLADAAQQRGVHCRFGMPGIIAEAHYDGGRNFITMQRGRKRYILSPPGECEFLHLLKDGPSARHSSADWSDPAQVALLSRALATEIVIEAGDALYVPALWFHYITSLTPNVQCNSRSGTPRLWEAELKRCGFAFGASEELGSHADADAAAKQPRRELHADALWRQHWPSTASVMHGLAEAEAAAAREEAAVANDGAEKEEVAEKGKEGGGKKAVDAISVAQALAAVRKMLPSTANPLKETTSLPPSHSPTTNSAIALDEGKLVAPRSAAAAAAIAAAREWAIVRPKGVRGSQGAWRPPALGRNWAKREAASANDGRTEEVADGGGNKQWSSFTGATRSVALLVSALVVVALFGRRLAEARAAPQRAIGLGGRAAARPPLRQQRRR